MDEVTGEPAPVLHTERDMHSRTHTHTRPHPHPRITWSYSPINDADEVYDPEACPEDQDGKCKHHLVHLYFRHGGALVPAAFLGRYTVFHYGRGHTTGGKGGGEGGETVHGLVNWGGGRGSRMRNNVMVGGR